MSVKTLRRAAALMRADWCGTAQEDFYSATADWLDEVADDRSECIPKQYRAAKHANEVARAYLGDGAE